MYLTVEGLGRSLRDDFRYRDRRRAAGMIESLLAGVAPEQGGLERRLLRDFAGLDLVSIGRDGIVVEDAESLKALLEIARAGLKVDP